jgi:hypothetical protein
VCHVGSFIQPALQSSLLQEVIQVRSVTKLLEYATIQLSEHYILDIDIDFWVSHIPTQEEITCIRKLYQQASICTIALSPYFMPLDESLRVLLMIFSD